MSEQVARFIAFLSEIMSSSSQLQKIHKVFKNGFHLKVSSNLFGSFYCESTQKWPWIPKITFCSDLPITFVVKDPQNFHKRERISKMRLQKHQRCPIPAQSISGQRVLKCETCGWENIVEILNYTFITSCKNTQPS